MGVLPERFGPVRKTPQMDRWQAMRVFVKVAETQSFARAARELHLSAPAVTRLVAGLEELVGARLLVRTTRSVKPTEAGARYLQDCRRILGEIAEAELAAAGHQARPSGTLAITAPMLFGQLHVLPLVLEFLARYPDMRVRTFFVDRQVNLLDEGMDVALRIGQLPDSGLTAIQVGQMRRVVCAAPSYLEAQGIPATPAALKEHRILACQGAWASPEWRFARGQRVVVDLLLLCNTNEAAHAIVLIADEIQTGFGRTGSLFAFQQTGVQPDLVTVAKSLAGGLPLSGVVGRAAIMDAPLPGGLGGTYGGNALACAAALAVLDIFEEEDLVARGVALGEQLRSGLLALQQRHPRIGEVRGRGFMLAVEMVGADGHSPDAALAQQVIDGARQVGLLVIKCGVERNVIRFLAPLVTTEAQLAEALHMFGQALAQAGA